MEGEATLLNWCSREGIQTTVPDHAAFGILACGNYGDGNALLGVQFQGNGVARPLFISTQMLNDSAERLGMEYHSVHTYTTSDEEVDALPNGDSGRVCTKLSWQLSGGDQKNVKYKVVAMKHTIL